MGPVAFLASHGRRVPDKPCRNCRLSHVSRVGHRRKHENYSHRRTFSDEVDTLHQEFDNHDFFFIHYKPADAAGEDGDFDAKVKALEDLDPIIPRIRELNPDVFMVAGDHSTPAIMAAHSWHPVPFMLHSNLTRGEGVPSFDERECNRGSIGSIPATNVMLLAMSHSGKLTKYGP